MQTAKFTPGMIYLVENQFEEKIGLSTTRHNYIVLGTIAERRNSNFQMVQAMNITSNPRNNGCEGREVPILLSNGAISYIIPYNIHSISFNDIEKGRFHGMIEDNEHFSTKRFIQMLIDIYNDELGLGFIDHTIIMAEYTDYCSWFFEKHKGIKEFRELTETKKEMKAPSLFDGKTIIYKNLGVEKKIQKQIQKIDDAAEEKESDVKLSVQKTESNDCKDIRKKYKKVSMMSTDERRAIESFTYLPYHMKDWKDDELILFIRAYEDYGPTNISSITPRWNGKSSTRHTYNVAKEIASKRKLALN